MVENTLKPIIDEIKAEVRDDHKKFVDRILNLKILDPAMGSGHFLVEITNFLAEEVVDHIESEETSEENDDDMTLAKRMIVEKCIYGVDSNPLATELAKVSLWLSTISRMKPLNFLDHHLKCGNSLIGASVEDIVRVLPATKLKKGSGSSREQYAFYGHVLRDAIRGLLVCYFEISKRPSDSLEDIKEKEKSFQEVGKIQKRHIQILNVYLSTYFENEVNQSEYYGMLESVRSGRPEEFKKFESANWFMRAQEINEDRKFFHWELEFPEVFFNLDGSRKENAGFDAVVGNPPYGLILDKKTKSLIQRTFASTQYQPSNYVAFMERAFVLTHKSGYQSLIVPTSFLTMHYFSTIRRFLLDNCNILELVHFKSPVFKDPTVESAIYLCRSESDKQTRLKNIVSGILVRDFDEFTSKRFIVQSVMQERFEQVPENDFNISLGPKEKDIVEKMLGGEVWNLGDLCDMTVGIKPYQEGKGEPKQTEEIVKNRAFDATYRKDESYHRYLMGRDIDRYIIELLKDRWLSYGEWLAEPRPAAPFFEPKRIVIRQTGDSIIAALEDEQRLTLNNIHNLLLRPQPPTYEFLLAILNSKLITFFHQHVVPEDERVFAEVKIVDLEHLPIPCILFTTNEIERHRLVENLELSYKKSNLDEIFTRIEEYLPKDEEGHFMRGKQKLDVIHDFLSFLAEEMISMNKEKNSEIRGFLEWLEGTIKVRIENFSGKNKIKEYYKHNFSEIRDIFEENKKLFNFNPRGREFLDSVKNEYNKSISKLKPLFEKIDATDNLIDHIVYRLYGLTEEEIQIIEQSFK